MDADQKGGFGEKIEPEWFKWVIHKRKSSIRKLGQDKAIGKTERTIRRAVKAKSIDPDLLDRIAKKLDVYPEYLAGRYAWTLNLSIMDEDGVRDYWRDNYLDPKMFPYRLAERFRVGSYRHLIDTLLIHGIPESDYKALDWSKRHELEQDLDRCTTRALRRYFPQHARPVEDLEYFQAMEWQDERDVIEAMLEYLEERGLVEVYTPEPDDDSDDPFFDKYKHLSVVSMPTMTRILIRGTSGYCSIDEAYTDKVVITPDWIRYEYDPLEISENNLPLRWTYQPSSLDYRTLFDEVARKVADIMDRDEVLAVNDIGSTTFIVRYPDGTQAKKEFFLPGDEFTECFSLVKKMVPKEEAVPKVLLTSADD